ncbi:hypothetical protein AMAG_15148 [Allomyces macrogynus ATCC 38327]|uniref:Uncharacterized protein n=1 Tax=Allomyces macrogynus (strain ATCC 38327) TaxID=578462 RepID=A0A0L0T5Z2_ALLM3|nr:hypothetical protein AMAG_15148 [Allomyces macrogynus ATCC 38327]|eukprot:KNE70177.1 hypothetical protein AMAG_15148 [Allomyces macrogynus ATCC 38327]
MLPHHFQAGGLAAGPPSVDLEDIFDLEGAADDTSAATTPSAPAPVHLHPAAPPPQRSVAPAPGPHSSITPFGTAPAVPPGPTPASSAQQFPARTTAASYLPRMQLPFGNTSLLPTGSPAAALTATASTKSPVASDASQEALLRALHMLANAQSVANAAAFTPSSPPPAPVGAETTTSPLDQLMQVLEQAQFMVGQLAAATTVHPASPIQAIAPLPRALKYALVTAATLKFDETFADARNAAAFVGGKSSWREWTVTMQDPPTSKRRRAETDAADAPATDDTTPFCVLHLHVLLDGANNQPLKPKPDTIVRMHVKIELETLKRPNVPTETVFDDWHAFTARPDVVLPVRFTRVLMKSDSHRKSRLKITLTPVGSEPIVVAGMPGTILCQSRRTSDRNRSKQTADCPPAAASSLPSVPAPPTPTPVGQKSKKRTAGQLNASSTDPLTTISEELVEDVRGLIFSGGAVAEIRRILGHYTVPYDVRHDLLETVLRVHLVTNAHAPRGPWSVAEFESVVKWLSDAPGKSVWTDHMLVHDIAQRCFDRDQLHAIFSPLLVATSSPSSSTTATPANAAATALQLALVTPDKDGHTPAHRAAYCVNDEFLVLVGRVYPVALVQLNAATKRSFLHSMAGRDGAAAALLRLRDELPPEIMEQAVRAVDTYGSTPLAMAKYHAEVKNRREVQPTVAVLCEMVEAMQVA